MPLCFEQSTFRCVHKTFCLKIRLWVVGWSTSMCYATWPAEMTGRFRCELCSIARDISLRQAMLMVMVEWVSVFFIGKISRHLERAFTTIRKLRPLIGPAKSTCTLDHCCSGYVLYESTFCGWFSCTSMQGTQLLTVFSMSESTLGQYTTLRAMTFIRLIPGCPACSCLRTAFLSFVGTCCTPYIMDSPSSINTRQRERQESAPINVIQLRVIPFA